MVRPVTVTVRQRFEAPVEVVFQAISDHERFIRGPGIRASRVTQPGYTEPNGLGAVREIEAVGVRFVEDITAWDPPHSYSYRVRQVSLPAEHEGGTLSCTARDGGTDVLWQTRYVMKLGGPLSPLTTQLSRPMFHVFFGMLLRRAARA